MPTMLNGRRRLVLCLENFRRFNKGSFPLSLIRAFLVRVPGPFAWNLTPIDKTSDSKSFPLVLFPSGVRSY